jgi:hypothetical protein
MYDNLSEFLSAPSHEHERVRDSEFDVGFILSYVGDFAYLLQVAVFMCGFKSIERSPHTCNPKRRFFGSESTTPMIDNSNVSVFE